MTLEEAVEVLRKEYKCESSGIKSCPTSMHCSDCPLYNDPDKRREAYRMLLKEMEGKTA